MTAICSAELSDWIDAAPTVLVLANGEQVTPCGCVEVEPGVVDATACRADSHRDFVQVVLRSLAGWPT